MAATVYARLKRLIVEQLGVEEDEVIQSASFTDDFNADSLELAEFTTAVEEEFGIEIPAEAARRLQSVQDALDYIEERVA